MFRKKNKKEKQSKGRQFENQTISEQKEVSLDKEEAEETVIQEEIKTEKDSGDNFKKNKSKKEEYLSERIKDADDLMQELIDELTQNKSTMINDVKRHKADKEEYMQQVLAYLNKYYKNYEYLFEETMKLFELYVFGYFRLDELINDKEISDIKVVTYDNVRIKKNGKRYNSDIKFKSEKEFIKFVQHVATKNSVQVSNLNASSKFDDKDSHEDFILRFVVNMPNITDNKNPNMVIRKIPRDFYEMDDLVEKHMMTNRLKDYLIDRFINGSCLICGPSASGKTTLLNALKEKIPHDSSVLVVQETGELTTKSHPDMIFEHPIENKGESKVQYSLYDIIKTGLLMDIDRFIIGENKGEEALFLLNASYTGHLCYTTIHAESAHTALDKLVDYAKYGNNYTKTELLKMVSSFKTVVFIKNFKVAEIVEIHGWNYEKNEPEYFHVDLDYYKDF